MFNKINPDLMLLTVAVIWGTGFIATEYAIDAQMSPILIMVLRFGVATLVLLAFTMNELRTIPSSEWIKGCIAGSLLFLGFLFQTMGQRLTTVSNSAFITATNVIYVPFIVWALTRQKPKNRIFFLTVLTFIGIAVLTVSPQGDLSINVGDLYVFICAVMFAFHIAYVGKAVSDADPKRMAFIQMLTASVFSLIGLAMEGPQTFEGVDYGTGLPAVLFLGVFSTSVCFFLQTSAQKRTHASKAGIILSTESLFGTIFSVILGIDPLTANIVIGGLIIMTAVVLTEVDVPFGRQRKILNLEE